ncbi:hypothetical protein JCM8097_005803 [Rhodosporidiobolus ruineniae]
MEVPENQAASSALSSLLALPVELLRDILSLAYPPSMPPPVAPICKSLQPLLLELLCRQPSFETYGGLAKLCRTIQIKPEYGALVKHLVVNIPWARQGAGKVTKEKQTPDSPSSREIQQLFRTLTSLKRLKLEGSTRLVRVLLQPETAATCLPELEDLILTSTFRGFNDPFNAAHYAALPFYRHIDSLNITIERKPSSIKPNSLPSLPTPPPLVFPALFRLCLAGPSATSTSARDFLSAFDGVGVLYLSDWDSKASLLSLLAALPDPVTLFDLTLDSIDHSYDSSIEEVLVNDFPFLDSLRLCGSTTSTSPSFYDTLRGLVYLSHLAFGYEAAVSTDELGALIAGARKHPSLKTLTLDNVAATMGTRIVEDANGEPYWDSEDEEADGIYPDWELGTWNEHFSRRGLKALLEVAKTSEVKVDGDAVEALKVEEAFDAEIDYMARFEVDFDPPE